MKAIIVNNDHIISLENVKEIKMVETGTGAKRNPYYYCLDVYYMNGERACTKYSESKAEIQEYFNKMFQIITAE